MLWKHTGAAISSSQLPAVTGKPNHRQVPDNTERGWSLWRLHSRNQTSPSRAQIRRHAIKCPRSLTVHTPSFPSVDIRGRRHSICVASSHMAFLLGPTLQVQPEPSVKLQTWGHLQTQPEVMLSCSNHRVVNPPVLPHKLAAHIYFYPSVPSIMHIRSCVA